MTSVEITNSETGKIYKFFDAEVPNITYSMNTKLLKETLPDDDGDDAIIINLGREKSWRFPFKMLNTTGTSESADPTGSIYTPTQKQEYLRNTFISAGIEDLYLITLTTLHGTITGVKGIVEDISIDFNGSNPESLNGSISFSVGGGGQ